MTVLRPTSLEAAVTSLSTHPSVRVVAGGTDVMVAVQAGTITLSAAMSLRAIPELHRWEHDSTASRVRIGATTTFAELAAAPIAPLVPALAQAARALGSVQIRNAATIGGSLGTGAANADALVVLAALAATVELVSSSGRRVVDAADLAAGRNDARARADELITSVEIPVLVGAQHFAKVAPRAAVAPAVVNATVVVDRENLAVRIALGGVAPTVVRIPPVEAWCTGAIDWTDPRPDPEMARELGRRVGGSIAPIDDDRATADYRRHAASVLTTRLLLRCLA